MKIEKRRFFTSVWYPYKRSKALRGFPLLFLAKIDERYTIDFFTFLATKLIVGNNFHDSQQKRTLVFRGTRNLSHALFSSGYEQNLILVISRLISARYLSSSNFRAYLNESLFLAWNLFLIETSSRVLAKDIESFDIKARGGPGLKKWFFF